MAEESGIRQENRLREGENIVDALKATTSHKNESIANRISEKMGPSPSLEKKTTNAMEPLERLRKVLEQKETQDLLKAKMEQKDPLVTDLPKEVQEVVEQLSKNPELKGIDPLENLGEQQKEAIEKALELVEALSAPSKEEEVATVKDQAVSTENALEQGLTNDGPPISEEAIVQESAEPELVQDTHSEESLGEYSEGHSWNEQEANTTLETGSSQDQHAEVTHQESPSGMEMTQKPSASTQNAKSGKKQGGLQRALSNVFKKAQRKLGAKGKRKSKGNKGNTKSSRSVLQKSITKQFVQLCMEYSPKQTSQTGFSTRSKEHRNSKTTTSRLSIS